MRLFGRGILAIGAHPDDIEFGCLGTFLQLEESPRVYCYVMTSGRGDAATRADETRAALDLPCVHRVEMGPFESATLRPDRETVREVAEQMERVPDLDTVLLPARWDTHQDHRALSEIVRTAARASRVSLLAYEGPSVLPGFPLDAYVELTLDALEEKIRRLNLHLSQIGHQYFRPAFLRRWHEDKQAAQLGLGPVERFHVHRLIA